MEREHAPTARPCFSCLRNVRRLGTRSRFTFTRGTAAHSDGARLHLVRFLYWNAYRGDLTQRGHQTNGNAANIIANVTANRRPAVLSTDDDFTMMSGIQAGYNVQFGSIVLGVEGDISHAGVKARDVFFSTLNDPSFFRQELHTFGTARARVGFAFDQVLVYATGGLAGANFTDRVAFLRNTDNAFQFVGRRSTTEYGYTVG